MDILGAKRATENLAGLEKQAAADVNATIDHASTDVQAITKGLLDGLAPQVARISGAVESIAASVNNLVVGVTGSVALLVAKADRINGAKITVTIEFGPEPGSAPQPGPEGQ